MTRRSAILVLGLATLAAGPARAQGTDPARAVHGRVVEVKGPSLKLDVGLEQGVRERQVFEVFQETRTWSLPFSGDGKLRVNRAIVARAVVVSVDRLTCQAHAFETTGKLELQQFAVHNAAAIPPDLPPRVRSHTPVGPEARIPWHRTVPVKLDVSLDPGRRAYYDWHCGGGVFVRGVQVSPGVFRTTGPENTWVAPWQGGDVTHKVTVTDDTLKTSSYAFALGSQGGTPGPMSVRLQKTLYEKTKFAGLRDVAFDDESNLFIVDGDELVRCRSQDGQDLGSAKVEDHDFIAIAATENALYLLDRKDSSVRRYRRGGAVTQIFTTDAQKIGEKGEGAGRIKKPQDVAIGSDGLVLVLDQGQRCVHAFAEDGKFVYAFGKPGEGENELLNPVALATDRQGRAYVLDDGRKRVHVFRQGHHEAEFVAGKPNEELTGLAVDPFGGAIFVLDRTQGQVKRFSRDGSQQSTYGKPEGELGTLTKASRLKIDASRVLHVIDRGGKSLVRLDAVEAPELVSRIGDEDISTTVALSATADGNVLILDKDARTVWKLDQQGWTNARIGREGSEAGQIKKAVGLGCARDGGLMILDSKKLEASLFSSSDGRFIRSYPGQGAYDDVVDMRFASRRSRAVILQDAEERWVTVLTADGGRPEPRATLPVALDDPVAATICEQEAPPPPDPATPQAEPTQRLWVVDKKGERVQVIDMNGRRVSVAGNKYDKVTGLAASVWGAVAVCDVNAKTVEVFTCQGQPIVTVKDETLGEPLEVTSDDLGNFYVFDRLKTGRVVVLAP